MAGPWRQHFDDESWRGSGYSSRPSVCLILWPRHDSLSKCTRHVPSQCANERHPPLNVRPFEHFQEGECLPKAHWLRKWRKHCNGYAQIMGEAKKSIFWMYGLYFVAACFLAYTSTVVHMVKSGVIYFLISLLWTWHIWWWHSVASWLVSARSGFIEHSQSDWMVSSLVFLTRTTQPMVFAQKQTEEWKKNCTVSIQSHGDYRFRT
jgi:hypothetical protein